jgi:hypothetical protein
MAARNIGLFARQATWRGTRREKPDACRDGFSRPGNAIYDGHPTCQAMAALRNLRRRLLN